MELKNVKVGDWVKYLSCGGSELLGEVTAVHHPDCNPYYTVGRVDIWHRSIIEVRSAAQAAALKVIAAYGVTRYGEEPHDGLCIHGCDCPHIAQQALAPAPGEQSGEANNMVEGK